jgi:hypothetical protein
MIANFEFGNAFAAVAVASASRNPTEIETS